MWCRLMTQILCFGTWRWSFPQFFFFSCCWQGIRVGDQGKLLIACQLACLRVNKRSTTSVYVMAGRERGGIIVRGSHFAFSTHPSFPDFFPLTQNTNKSHSLHKQSSWRWNMKVKLFILGPSKSRLSFLGQRFSGLTDSVYYGLTIH